MLLRYLILLTSNKPFTWTSRLGKNVICYLQRNSRKAKDQQGEPTQNVTDNVAIRD